MDKRTRELIKKIARMNHGFKDEKHDENESEDTMHENVPILIKESFSLLDLIKLSENKSAAREPITTSEVGVSHTAIVVGTTHNKLVLKNIGLTVVFACFVLHIGCTKVKMHLYLHTRFIILAQYLFLPI